MEDQKISPAVPQSSKSISLAKTSAMASSSTQPVGATKKLTLKPVMALESHEPVHSNIFGRQIPYISYFPDGKGMVSASFTNKTIRQWDLRTGKVIEEAQNVCGREVPELAWKVAVSRDGRWVVTSSHTYTPGQDDIGELKARDLETGVVKRFQGHSRPIKWVDISPDSMLLAGGSWNSDGVWIWSLESGKLVGGPSPFALGIFQGVGRFSQDSKKLAILSDTGRCLEVWDVQTQKLDVRKEESHYGTVTDTPIFWTTKDKSIVAVFDFKDLDQYSEYSGFQPDPDLNTIYEFDALTLEIVGAPFKGHTHYVSSLALSSDCALLASASRHDNTIKLWAFESRQLLASITGQSMINLLIFSPNSHQLAYTDLDDTKICIYDPPPDILSGIWPAQEAQPKIIKNTDLLNSDATPRAARRNPAISHVPRTLRPPPTIHPKQRFIRYLRKLLPSPTNGGPPIRNDEPRNPLDFSATSPLPRSLSAQATTQRRSGTDSRENSQSTPPPPTTRSSAATTFNLHRLSTWWPIRADHPSPPIIYVPYAQGKERNAAAGAPKRNEDLIPDEDHVPSRPTSPNPDSRQPPAAAPVTTEEHGSGRLCGCF